jgi:DNA anti-recombination protein RmuC
MKNEDKIVELLSEMLIRQDRFESRLDKITDVMEKLVPAIDQLGTGVEQLGTGLEKLSNSQERLIAIQERQEKILINILEVLADDVPKFDELIEMEQLGEKKVVLRKTK